MTAFLSVFAAQSSATLRASAGCGRPIALIAVAMDVEVAIAGMNHVAYGSGRRASEPSGPFTVESGWDDWRLLRVAPGSAAPASRSESHDGTIGVPFGIPTISAFARRLTGLLRPRSLGAVVGDPGMPLVGPRYVLLDAHNLTGRLQRVYDLYAFDADLDADWLHGVVEEALSDPDGAARPGRKVGCRRSGSRK